jgi:hypothetical protein
MPDLEDRMIDPPDRDETADKPDSSPISQSGSESRSVSDPSENTTAFDGVFSGDGLEASQTATAKSGEIPTTLGRFKINGVLGTGGFGTVYLGFDDRLKRKVAIKVPIRVLSGVELDKFLEEAQRLAQLRHPGIVTVFDVGEFDGRCYIVSDHLDGLSLADWMDSRSYGWRAAALIVAQLADALAHAHSHGTIHRDIKHPT